MTGAPIADPLGRKGGKRSVWISGADDARLAELGITAGEALRRGLAAIPDKVQVPDGLDVSLNLVARVAVALSNGARLTWPQDADSAPVLTVQESSDREAAAWRDGYETAAGLENPHSEQARSQFEALMGRPLRDLPPMEAALEAHLAAAAAGGQLHLEAHLAGRHGWESQQPRTREQLDAIHRELGHPHRERESQAAVTAEHLAQELLERSGGVRFLGWGDRPLTAGELAAELTAAMAGDRQPQGRCPGCGQYADHDPKSAECPGGSGIPLKAQVRPVDEAIERIREREDPPWSGGVQL